MLEKTSAMKKPYKSGEKHSKKLKMKNKSFIFRLSRIDKNYEKKPEERQSNMMFNVFFANMFSSIRKAFACNFVRANTLRRPIFMSLYIPATNAGRGVEAAPANLRLTRHPVCIWQL
jgi:hypothetical protein